MKICKGHLSFSKILLILTILLSFQLTSVLSLSSLISPPAISAKESTAADKKMEDGAGSFRIGDFENAILDWSVAVKIYKDADSISGQINALSRLAEAYKSLGQYRKSLTLLKSALELAESANDKSLITAVMAGLGDVYILTGSTEQAENYLKESLAIAKEADDQAAKAVIMNHLGNLLVSQNKFLEAQEAFQQSISHAQQTGKQLILAQSTVNAAAAYIQNKQYQNAASFLSYAVERFRALDDSHYKAYGLIKTGQLYRLLMQQDKAHFPRLAYEALHEASRVAETIGDYRAGSYAAGYMGQLYEDAEKYKDALQLTRKALFAAQKVNISEILFRWQWQTGRLLRKEGNLDGATSTYRRAVYTLQSIRHDFAGSYGSPVSRFSESAGPLFFEFIDLLFQQAASLGKKEVVPYLVEARETAELLKEAELQDYFQDQCVSAVKAKAMSIDHLSSDTAVVYAIILPDRTELLLSLPSGLTRVTSLVPAKTLTKEVRKFRVHLEKRTTREYLPYAQKLYDWLIRPIETELETNNVKTLIFVPDAALRTIPMSTLHDGDRFLIEKYAIATTPGLNLTDPRPIQREKIDMLLVGLTKSVQGFPPLKHVSSELKEIQSIFGGTLLKDNDFLIPKMEVRLAEKKFSIVHVASHGKFENDIEKTFLLTFDDKLTMDRLEQLVGLSQYRDKPVELLTLSACQTAAGDDRAALGLAGVAVKAGARSALATLWFVNDKATSVLVGEFYRQFLDPSISKAKALQMAQMKLLSDRRYRHPGYWSPFLLIGNWL